MSVNCAATVSIPLNSITFPVPPASPVRGQTARWAGIYVFGEELGTVEVMSNFGILKPDSHEFLIAIRTIGGSTRAVSGSAGDLGCGPPWEKWLGVGGSFPRCDIESWRQPLCFNTISPWCNATTLLEKLYNLVSGEVSTSWEESGGYDQSRLTFLQDSVLVEDALGHEFPVPSEYDYALLVDIIRHMFKTGPGSAHIMRGAQNLSRLAFKTKHRQSLWESNADSLAALKDIFQSSVSAFVALDTEGYHSKGDIGVTEIGIAVLPRQDQVTENATKHLGTFFDKCSIQSYLFRIQGRERREKKRDAYQFGEASQH
ncbi:hypothetical protein B0H67DRAFT_640438 [Lasiosphaeris hirsuta]|uniref:Uncharacterized protein n=1 Tax=Lasiosphaeris hirsuta TaxID=260670 RepID=A0AA40E8G4_9PEZI|nr:hypothetical protein B0H67DRAFT_640438 [Lasiosphaeris hirsuta]